MSSHWSVLEERHLWTVPTKNPVIYGFGEGPSTFKSILGNNEKMEWIGERYPISWELSRSSLLYMDGKGILGIQKISMGWWELIGSQILLEDLGEELFHLSKMFVFHK